MPDFLQDFRVAVRVLWHRPGFTAVAKGEKGGRFIVPDKGEIARILAKHTFLKPLTLAAGMFPGQDKAIDSVGSWSFVMARPDLEETVAYRLAKAVHKGEASIAARLPQAAETTARNTATAVADPAQLHPGVRRYLREFLMDGRVLDVPWHGRVPWFGSAASPCCWLPTTNDSSAWEKPGSPVHVDGQR